MFYNNNFTFLFAALLYYSAIQWPSHVLSFITVRRPIAVLLHYNNNVIFRSKNIPDEDNNDNKNKSPILGKSRFDRLLDDFVNKRYGGGQAFYGKRLSSLSEDEYQEEMKKRQSSQVGNNNNNDKDYELRGNAILVVGDVRDDILQWTVLDLLEKGFTVRLGYVGCGREQVVREFGLQGRNVDMVGLDDDNDDMERVLTGTQALVLVDNLRPSLREDKRGTLKVLKLLQTASQMRQQQLQQDLQKIVLCSRVLPTNLISNNNNNDISGIVKYWTDKIFSIVFEIVTKSRCSCELSSDLSVFSSWREQHQFVEDVVRSTGIDYNIVRTPKIVKKNRLGSVDQLFVLDRQGRSSSSSNSIKEEEVEEIGSLDLSEVLVQSLLLESVDRKTFTVGYVSQSSIQTQQQQQQRVSRDNYYRILSLDVNSEEEESRREMRKTYMIRKSDSDRDLLNEDIEVETFWKQTLSQLPSDQ